MVFFTKRMPDPEKNLFRLFISEKRNGKRLVSMFRAFDRCDPFGEAKGVHGFVIWCPLGPDHSGAEPD